MVRSRPVFYILFLSNLAVLAINIVITLTYEDSNVRMLRATAERAPLVYVRDTRRDPELRRESSVPATDGSRVAVRPSRQRFTSTRLFLEQLDVFASSGRLPKLDGTTTRRLITLLETCEQRRVALESELTRSRVPDIGTWHRRIRDLDTDLRARVRDGVRVARPDLSDDAERTLVHLIVSSARS